MEKRIKNGTIITYIDPDKTYTICNAIKTDNQWGYGVYLYQFEELIESYPGFGLYRKEFDIV